MNTWKKNKVENNGTSETVISGTLPLSPLISSSPETNALF